MPGVGGDRAGDGARCRRPAGWLLLLVVLPVLFGGLAVLLGTRSPDVPVAPVDPEPRPPTGEPSAAAAAEEAPRGLLRIRVVGQKEQPLAGVRLELVSDPGGERHTVLAAGRTAPDGCVELPAEPGTWGLRAFSRTHFARRTEVRAPREDVVVIGNTDLDSAVDASGNALTCQPVGGGLAVKVSLPAMGATTISLGRSDKRAASPFVYEGNVLETPHYRVTLDPAGRIAGLYDKSVKREVVREGRQLNAFYTADDMPSGNDAWDIDRDYRRTVRHEERLESLAVEEDGPLLFSLRSRYRIGRRSKAPGPNLLRAGGYGRVARTAQISAALLSNRYVETGASGWPRRPAAKCRRIRPTGRTGA